MPPRNIDHCHLAPEEVIGSSSDDDGPNSCKVTETWTPPLHVEATSKGTAAGGGPGGNGNKCPNRPFISTTSTLCILVMIDMLSVSLVVPLLHQYYKNAGIASANQRELLSSLFSSSQIAGGLMIGALSDAGILSRRNILLLSFLGSALSYALIVIGGFRNLIVSRVIVGLVKQTMTVSTSILARITTAENRAVNMGRLTSASTVAWIVGPSAGALLYKNVDASAPALAACGLFLINSLLAAVLIPNDHGDGTTATSPSSDSKARQCSNQSEKCAKGGKFSSFSKNLRACFSSSMLAPVVIGLLLFGWVTRATSYANMASFYEEKYGIETHQRGYLKSYQQILNFVFQSFFVRAFLSAAGGERKAACIASFVLAAATLVELRASFAIFVCVVCPAVTVAVGMIGLSLKSILTQVAPKESLGSVLAALDVLTNAASVSVPFYRTGLFSVLSRIAGAEDEEASMRGDPDPNLWLLSSFCHWTLFAIVVSCLLMLPRFSIERKTPKKKKAQ